MMKKLPNLYYDEEDLRTEVYDYFISTICDLIPESVLNEIEGWDISTDNIIENLDKLIHRISVYTVKSDSKKDGLSDEDYYKLAKEYGEINAELQRYRQMDEDMKNGTLIIRPSWTNETIELLADDCGNVDMYTYYLKELIKIEMEEKDDSGQSIIHVRDVLNGLYGELKQRNSQDRKGFFRKIFGKAKDEYRRKTIDQFLPILRAYYGLEENSFKIVLAVGTFVENNAPNKPYAAMNEKDFFIILDETEVILKDQGEEFYGKEEQNLLGICIYNAVNNGLLSQERYILQLCDVFRTDGIKTKFITKLKDKKFSKDFISKVINEFAGLGGYGVVFAEYAFDNDENEEYDDKTIEKITKGIVFTGNKIFDKCGDKQRLEFIGHLEITGKSKDYIVAIIWGMVQNGGYGANFLDTAVNYTEWENRELDAIIENANLDAAESENFLHLPMSDSTREKLLDTIALENPERAQKLFQTYQRNLGLKTRLRLESKYNTSSEKPGKKNGDGEKEKEELKKNVSEIVGTYISKWTSLDD